MKFITGNRNTREQWKNDIVDTKKSSNFRDINQNSDETIHQWNPNDSVSDSDTAPPFKSENR
jgi:hypothetical protein